MNVVVIIIHIASMLLFFPASLLTDQQDIWIINILYLAGIVLQLLIVGVSYFKIF